MVRNYWPSRRVVVVGLALSWVALAGCRPTGRRALVEGDRLLQSGKPAEAVPLFEQAAADLPTDGTTWNLLGRSYHELGRTADARKAYLRALDADRNLFEAHYNLGQLSLETGVWREAESGFRIWLNAVTNSGVGAAPAWRGLGLAQFQQHNSAEAERSFGMALRLDANDAESWNAVGLIRQQRKQYRDAFNTFAHAARLAPKFAAPRLNAAVVAHQFLNDRRTALEYYRAYVALGPADSAAINQVIAHLEAGVGTVTGPANALTALATNFLPSASIPRATPPTGTSAVNGSATLSSITSAVSPRVHPPPTTDHALSTTPTPTLAPTLAATPPTPVIAAKPEPAPTVAREPLANPTRNSPTTANPPLVANPPKAVAVSSEPTPTPTPTLAPSATPSAPVITPVVTKPVRETPPLEVVRIEERPIFRPARDPEPLPLQPTPTAISPADRPDRRASIPITVSTPSEPSASPAATPVAAAPPNEPIKPSLWAKANPVNWFKRDRSAATSAAKRPTPLDLPASPSSPFPVRPTSPAVPGPQVNAVQVPLVTHETATALPTVLPPSAPPPPSKPVSPQYARQITQPPSPGNRAEADVEFQRAVAAHRLQDLGPAITGYRQAVAADPTYFEAQHNLALAALAQNELPTALRAAETATVLRPADVSAHYQFAVALQRSRFPVDAAAQLEEVARLEQTNAAAHFAVAGLYANDLQDPERARIHYERVLALEPNHPHASTIRRWLRTGR